MAKLAFRRLEALGAAPLAPLGLGDDQHRSGHEAALDPWLPQLWRGLRQRFPLAQGLSEVGRGTKRVSRRWAGLAAVHAAQLSETDVRLRLSSHCSRPRRTPLASRAPSTW